MKVIRLRAVGLFATVAIVIGLIPSAASAQAISNQDVKEQKRVVMVELVETLEENVKLMQMLLIQRLEDRVKELQKLVSAQA